MLSPKNQKIKSVYAEENMSIIKKFVNSCTRLSTTQIPQSTMEPEESFLENACIMLNYAEKEMKQFTAWTHTHRAYSNSPDSIIARMENLTAEIKQLKKEFTGRSTSVPASFLQSLMRHQVE